MLVAYTSTPVAVDVIDYVRGETRLKQCVVSHELNIRNNPDGSSTVRLPLQIDSYTVQADGSRGELVAHATRPDVLVSEMARAVNPETGATRYRLLTSTTAYNYATNEEEAVPGGDWPAYLEAKEEPLMLQPFFLRQLFDQLLRGFCEQYIHDADAEPSRFA